MLSVTMYDIFMALEYCCAKFEKHWKSINLRLSEHKIPFISWAKFGLIVQNSDDLGCTRILFLGNKWIG